MFEKHIYSGNLLFGSSFQWLFFGHHLWLVALEIEGDSVMLKGCSCFSWTAFIVLLSLSSLCREENLADHSSNFIAAYSTLVMKSA